MAETVQALRERHATLAQKTRALVEENNDCWEARHQEQYDSAMNELDDIKAQIDRTTKLFEKMADEAVVNVAEEAHAGAVFGGEV